MEKLFLLIYENADGVGGDRIVYGYSYNELMRHLLDQYHAHFDDFRDQIEEEHPEVLERIAQIERKKICTEKDVADFDLMIVGVTFRCNGIFVGKNGLSDLVEYIKDDDHFWHSSCSDSESADCESLLTTLTNSYDDDRALNHVLEIINERIWCG